MSDPFQSHMTFIEAMRLKVGDRIDHRLINGKCLPATIIKKNHATLRIRYDANTELDVESNPITELHRFAKHGSISQRPGHRLTNVRKGTFVDVNVIIRAGWRKAEIIATDRHSGQIEVQYKYDISDGRQKAGKWGAWVHVDNVNEVDKYGIHSSIKTIEHLPISLETKRAYLNTPNEVKECCTEEIIESVYGGMTNLLSHLIENASTSELQQMHEIMKKKTIKYQETVKTTNNEGNKNKNTNNKSMNNKMADKPKKSSLSEVSRDCIDHICGYLNREDIKSFKLTSYRNGISSLHQMTKSTVSVQNMNSIINPENPHYVDMVGIVGLKTFDRYPANMKYLALLENWEEKFKIPLSKQVIFRSHTKTLTMYDNDNDTINNELIKTIPTLDFILFDGRNTIIFNKDGDASKIIDDIFNINIIINKLAIALIKYFDIFSQKMVPLQILIGVQDKMTVGRLTKYFEHEFIATTPHQKMWHSKIMDSFKEMNKMAPNHGKLIVYTESNKKRKVYPAINPIDTLKPSVWTICIFQLNPKHPSFSKCKFPTIPEKYDLLTQ